MNLIQQIEQEEIKRLDKKIPDFLRATPSW